MPKKIRLDHLIAQRYPNLSKMHIQSLIMQGKVRIACTAYTKPGTFVLPDAECQVDLYEPKYVSRAGWKLEHALDAFNIDVTGKVVLDAGLSTGGFANCLLQRGAQRVYGVDVGYGQVHEKVANNERLVVMERTNLRQLGKLPEPVDLVTLDLSFISVLKVLDSILQNLKPEASIIVLIKPQFEAARHQVGKGGIVTDERVHTQVIKQIKDGFAQKGLSCLHVVESPILGGHGNKEFLAHFKLEHLSSL